MNHLCMVCECCAMNYQLINEIVGLSSSNWNLIIVNILFGCSAFRSVHEYSTTIANDRMAIEDGHAHTLNTLKLQTNKFGYSVLIFCTSGGQ